MRNKKRQRSSNQEDSPTPQAKCATSKSGSKTPPQKSTNPIMECTDTQEPVRDQPGAKSGVTLEHVMAKLNILEPMQKDLSDIKKEMGELTRTIEFSQQDIDDLQVRMAAEEERTLNLQIQVEKLEAERNEWRQAQEHLQRQITSLEAHSRRDNLVFENVAEEEGENCAQKLASIIKKDLGIQTSIQFSRVHRLHSDNKPRPLIAKFHFFPHRDLVWSRRSSLKGNVIRMREDYPNSISKDRAVLAPFVRAAYNNSMKAKLVKDKLIVDGTVYSAADVTSGNVPEMLKPRNVFEKKTEDGQHYLFASRHSPFSNWHDAPFTLNGVTYTCSEQYYLSKMAQASNDTKRAQGIMETAEPSTMKRIARKIKVNESMWKKERDEHMKAAISAKFAQNDNLKQDLIKTHPLMLVECNMYDPYWSCGMSIFSKDIEDSTIWKGKNALGRLLTELRKELMSR